MPLTTLDRVLSWAKKAETFEESRQEELARACTAASRTISRVTGRKAERVTRSISLNGNRASGGSNELLYLPPGDRPVLHTGSDLITVTEDGATVTVGIGYSPSSGCVVENANVDERVCLIRNGSWSSGYQNILVGYKCGWALDTTGDTQPVPEEVIQLANCIAWKIFQEPAWLGKLNIAQAGSAVTLSNELPPEEAAILASLVIL